MSVATIQFHSQALGKRVAYQAILPEQGEGPFPVLFQLHALMDRLCLKHHYVENPGGSNWDYWDEHVPEALAQHARVLLTR